jgi:hypothetical protein
VTENWKHGLWRRMRRQPTRGIGSETSAQPLLNRWRDATRESTDQRPTEIEDATKRTLDAELQRVWEHPTEP